MSTIGGSCMAVIFVLCGMSPWLSASALGEEGSKSSLGDATYDMSTPPYIIDASDILGAEEVSENELLARFIFDQGDKYSLIPLYAYSFDKVCGDTTAEKKETDWFQEYWAKRVNEVGIVAVIPKSKNKWTSTEDDDIAPLSFGSYYSGKDGNLARHTQDSYCEMLKNFVPKSGESAWFRADGYVAIQYPYVDWEYEERFFLKSRYGEYGG